MTKNFSPSVCFQGEISVPGDKSLSHRALLLAALSKGISEVTNIGWGQDVQATAEIISLLGVQWEKNEDKIIIHGRGRSWKTSEKNFDCKNSGTTMRLLTGILAAMPEMKVSLIGDSSLSQRPMQRIVEPLVQLGANISCTEKGTAPLLIEGALLQDGEFELPMASAQVKSALLLAALVSKKKISLRGQIKSRNHMEQLLQKCGVHLQITDQEIFLNGNQELFSFQQYIPGDFSSAAFFITLALIYPQSHILIKGVGLNPTRIGFLKVLQRMGAHISVDIKCADIEPWGDIKVKYSCLTSTQILPEEVPFLIDEIPLIALLALFSEGKTMVEGAQELRHKESDRLLSLQKNILALGGNINMSSSGFSIEGPQKLSVGELDSFGDHRLAMTFSLLQFYFSSKLKIKNSGVVDVSYPHFFSDLKSLQK